MFKRSLQLALNINYFSILYKCHYAPTLLSFVCVLNSFKYIFIFKPLSVGQFLNVMSHSPICLLLKLKGIPNKFTLFIYGKCQPWDKWLRCLFNISKCIWQPVSPNISQHPNCYRVELAYPFLYAHPNSPAQGLVFPSSKGSSLYNQQYWLLDFYSFALLTLHLAPFSLLFLPLLFSPHRPAQLGHVHFEHNQTFLTVSALHFINLFLHLA